MQNRLIVKPDFGKLISGSGVLRKLRWSSKGHGKRGGIRVIYYWVVSVDRILVLLAYSKSERDNLTREQLKTLKRIVEEEYL